MINLTGKKALVIGGSRGIGAATVKRLAEQGADVALTYGQSRGRAEDVAREVEALGRKAVVLGADATRKGATAKTVEDAAKKLGGLDILVVAAGQFDVGPLDELTDDRFDNSVNLHIRATFEAARAAAPLMKEGGRIINFGTILGERVPFPGLGLYTTTKAAVTAFTQVLARELGPRGITANSVQPGPINTEMNPAGEENPSSDFQRSQTALGRFGTAEEVAALVAFLASDEAGFISGQGINIDGGWTA